MQMDSRRPSTSDEYADAIDYRRLAEFRLALRRFQAFSETAAKEVGLTTQQHQALLTVQGFGGKEGLGVGDLAEALLLRHNSAAELVNRLVALGYVERASDDRDGRRAIVRLTRDGERKLASLSSVHLAELRAIGPRLRELIEWVSAAPDEV